MSNPRLTCTSRLDYQKTIIDLTAQQQKEPWFLEINPNGHIPAMTDVDENGEEIKLFESGSILQYLVDRYDPERRISYPRGSKQAVEVNNWLFFQVASVGPMQGQGREEIFCICFMLLTSCYSKPLLPICERKDPIRHSALPE